MKIVLFCENRYAIDILQPLAEEAVRQGRHEVLWYVDTSKIRQFSLPDDVRWSASMQDIYDFMPEAIFAPGNIVPYYLPGVKIQVFHGYAAEKKDQFRIRNYFDLYLTQGPYFTKKFLRLQKQYKDFEVCETGWTKQDWIKAHMHDYDHEKHDLLARYGKKSIVLYAPTFSPRLTSLPYLRNDLGRLLRENHDILMIMKFHPLTSKQWCEEYRQWAGSLANAIYIDSSENITRYQMMSDVMISDTSSTVYEFLLLDRPVITLRSIAKDIYWKNMLNEDELPEAYASIQADDEAKAQRRWIIDNYDPHMDGRCCERMISAAEDFIARNGVPERRSLNLWRKYTSIKTFGFIRR